MFDEQVQNWDDEDHINDQLGCRETVGHCELQWAIGNGTRFDNSQNPVLTAFKFDLGSD